MENTARDASFDEIPMETFSALDPGVYRARCEKIETIDTKFGPALKFYWKVVGGDADGEMFDALANKKLLPKSKLATWAKAHLGVTQFPEGFVLQVGTLVGKMVDIVLLTEPRNDGTGDRNVVEAISPIARKAAKPATESQGAHHVPGSVVEKLMADLPLAPPSALFDDVPDPAMDEPMTARQKQQAAMHATAKAPKLQEEVPF